MGGARAPARRTRGARAALGHGRLPLPAGLALRLRLLPDRDALDRAAVRSGDHGAVAQVPGLGRGGRLSRALQRAGDPARRVCSRGRRARGAGRRRWTGRRESRRGSRWRSAFPVVFLFVEELRASGEIGFPWFQPGYTQHAYVPIIQLASLGSVSLVTLWVVLVNVLLWRALGGARPPALGAGRALPRARALALGAARAAGHRRTGGAAGPVPGGGAGAGERGGGDQVVGEAPVRDPRARSSGSPRRRRDAGHGPSWPSGRRPRPAATCASSSTRRSPWPASPPARACPCSRASPTTPGTAGGRQHSYNAAGLFATDGTLGPVYAKRHLVPFGERMPFQRLFPWLGRLELGQAEWTPGERAVLFPSAAGPFACLVCFEAIFPDLSRERRAPGCALDREPHERRVVRERRGALPACGDVGLPRGGEPRPAGALRQHRPHAGGGRERPRGRHAAGVRAGCPRDGSSRAPPRSAFPTPYTRFGDWPGLLSLIAVAGLGLRAWARSR